MSLAADIIADWPGILAALGSEALTFTRTGPGTTTAIAEAFVQKTERSFGSPSVPGYEIDEVVCHFLVSLLSPTPKLGDTITRAGTVYEVTEAKKIGRDVLWRLVTQRASLNADYAITVTQQRATLTQDAMGAPVETWGTVTTHQAIRMDEDDVADMIDRLGVAGDKQAITLFVAQSASFLPMDRILIGSRPYRITLLGDEGRISRLKKIRIELYA